MTAPVVPPPTLGVAPVMVTVGVPAEVPMTPLVALLKLPAMEILELRFSVVLAPTLILLLIVFVPLAS